MPTAEAVRASYQFGGGVTSVSWAWDPTEGGWVRTQNGTPHLDMGNWPVTVDNVVLEYLPYAGSTSQDIYGNDIPEAQMHGELRVKPLQEHARDLDLYGRGVRA